MLDGSYKEWIREQITYLDKNKVDRNLYLDVLKFIFDVLSKNLPKNDEANKDYYLILQSHFNSVSLNTLLKNQDELYKKFENFFEFLESPEMMVKETDYYAFYHLVLKTVSLQLKFLENKNSAEKKYYEKKDVFQEISKMIDALEENKQYVVDEKFQNIAFAYQDLSELLEKNLYHVQFLKKSYLEFAVEVQIEDKLNKEHLENFLELLRNKVSHQIFMRKKEKIEKNPQPNSSVFPIGWLEDAYHEIDHFHDENESISFDLIMERIEQTSQFPISDSLNSMTRSINSPELFSDQIRSQDRIEDNSVSDDNSYLPLFSFSGHAEIAPNDIRINLIPDNLEDIQFTTYRQSTVSSNDSGVNSLHPIFNTFISGELEESRLNINESFLTNDSINVKKFLESDLAKRAVLSKDLTFRELMLSDTYSFSLWNEYFNPEEDADSFLSVTPFFLLSYYFNSYCDSFFILSISDSYGRLNINSTNFIGQTLLHIFLKEHSSWEHVERLEFLLKHGIDTSLKSLAGVTAMHLFFDALRNKSSDCKQAAELLKVITSFDKNVCHTLDANGQSSLGYLFSYCFIRADEIYDYFQFFDINKQYQFEKKCFMTSLEYALFKENDDLAFLFITEEKYNFNFDKLDKKQRENIYQLARRKNCHDSLEALNQLHDSSSNKHKFSPRKRAKSLFFTKNDSNDYHEEKKDEDMKEKNSPN